MALQAREYEKRYKDDMPDMNLQPFYDSSLPKLREAEIKSWGECLQKERNGTG
jgi:putative hydrolases of HD superfamily